MGRDRSSIALTFLCQVISPWIDLQTVAHLRHQAEKKQIAWDEVARHANQNNVAPALFWGLNDSGLADCVPPEFLEYLEFVYRANHRQNTAILKQLPELVRLLNDVEIVPILLKGGASLLTGLYPDSGIRYMCDLDILVPHKDLPRAKNALLSGGYVHPGSIPPLNYTNKEHDVPLLHPRYACTVELHRRLFRDSIGILELENLWKNKRVCNPELLPELSADVLDPTDDLLYSFAHSELKHGCHNKEVINVRQLMHFSFLCHRYCHEIDWGRVKAVTDNGNLGAMFRSFLVLAQRLFNVQLPFVVEQCSVTETHIVNTEKSRQGWRKGRKLLRLVAENLQRSFSREHLQEVYPNNRRSLNFLRWKYFLILVVRYRHPGNWRAKYKNLIPY